MTTQPTATVTVISAETLAQYPYRMNVSWACSGDGSKFCCARNGCHPICNCSL